MACSMETFAMYTFVVPHSPAFFSFSGRLSAWVAGGKFLPAACENNDLGFALRISALVRVAKAVDGLYFITCLLRYALSLAVHGLMMLSEGEM
jgi:hypothetical protein